MGLVYGKFSEIQAVSFGVRFANFWIKVQWEIWEFWLYR
ncbi:Uncharacterised protein [Pasteurella canis]|nr:Uncharacterised protein [Pasteurella canis]